MILDSGPASPGLSVLVCATGTSVARPSEGRQREAVHAHPALPDLPTLPLGTRRPRSFFLPS